MKEQFDNLKATRKLLKLVTEKLSQEQLNKIPTGFNNNIAWNIGHVVVTQQLLVYALSGVKPNVSKELIRLFRKGSTPEKPVSDEQMKDIFEKMEASVDQTFEDYQKGVFKTYEEYPTSYGITLRSVEQAIAFNNMHEAMHLGYILAMKRVL